MRIYKKYLVGIVTENGLNYLCDRDGPPDNNIDNAHDYGFTRARGIVDEDTSGTLRVIEVEIQETCKILGIKR